MQSGRFLHKQKRGCVPLDVLAVLFVSAICTFPFSFTFGYRLRFRLRRDVALGPNEERDDAEVAKALCDARYHGKLSVCNWAIRTIQCPKDCLFDDSMETFEPCFQIDAGRTLSRIDGDQIHWFRGNGSENFTTGMHGYIEVNVMNKSEDIKPAWSIVHYDGSNFAEFSRITNIGYTTDVALCSIHARWEFNDCAVRDQAITRSFLTKSKECQGKCIVYKWVCSHLPLEKGSNGKTIVQLGKVADAASHQYKYPAFRKEINGSTYFGYFAEQVASVTSIAHKLENELEFSDCVVLDQAITDEFCTQGCEQYRECSYYKWLCSHSFLKNGTVGRAIVQVHMDTSPGKHDYTYPIYRKVINGSTYLGYLFYNGVNIEANDKIDYCHNYHTKKDNCSNGTELKVWYMSKFRKDKYDCLCQDTDVECFTCVTGEWYNPHSWIDPDYAYLSRCVPREIKLIS